MKARKYIAEFDCGNDIVRKEIRAFNLKTAKVAAQWIKKNELDNDRRIKTRVTPYVD